MSLLIDSSGAVYRPLVYSSESDFEASVVSLADQIFGSSTIYIDVKRRVSGNDIVTIPDGYVLDMTEPPAPKLFIVENEIVSHDPFKHIGIQMLRFVTSFEGAQAAVRSFLMEEISKDPDKKSRLENGCSGSPSRNIDNYLDQAVFGPFRGVVLIDEARPELHHVLEKINANISVLELRTFESDSGERIHLFDTLYEEYDEAPAERVPAVAGRSRDDEASERARRRRRRAECDTIIVPAWEDGFEEAFIGEDCWYQIRISPAMKERIKYIAAYRVAPISAVTHMAEVKEIRPYEDTGRYIVIFKEPAKEIRQVPVKNLRRAPQGPVYAKRDKLLSSKTLEEALSD